MPALPLSTDFTASSVTEGQFKTALTSLRDYLNGLLGADGLPATARTALGVSQTINEVAIAANTTLVAATHFARTLVATTNGQTITLPTPATAGNGWWCNVVLGGGVSLVNIARGGTTDVIFDAGASTAGAASLVMPGAGPTSNLWNTNAITLMCNGTNWRVISSDAAHGTQLFTASTNWVCPQGVTKVMVSGVGGSGGAGGSQTVFTPSAVTYLGGAGGAGGVRWRNLVTVAPGTSYPVVIGANGSVGGTGANGTAGTATTFSTVTCPGGGAGGGASSSADGVPGSAGASDAIYAALAGGPYLQLEW